MKNVTYIIYLFINGLKKFFSTLTKKKLLILDKIVRNVNKQYKNKHKNVNYKN